MLLSLKAFFHPRKHCRRQIISHYNFSSQQPFCMLMFHGIHFLFINTHFIIITQGACFDHMCYRVFV